MQTPMTLTLNRRAQLEQSRLMTANVVSNPRQAFRPTTSVVDDFPDALPSRLGRTTGKKEDFAPSVFNFASPRNQASPLPSLTMDLPREMGAANTSRLSQGSALDRFGRLRPTYEFESLKLQNAATIHPVFLNREQPPDESFSTI